MNVLGRVAQALADLASTRGLFAAARALLTWPRFSLTAFVLARRLRALGVTPEFVVDVGANDGQFSVAVSRTFPDARVVAYEPQADAYERLCRNLLREGKAECHRLALGAQEGEAILHVASDDRSSSLRRLGEGHKLAFARTRERSTETVTVKRLDDVVRVPTGASTLIKLDVQGFEDQVLAGATATLSAAHWALLECSFVPMYEGEVTLPGIVALMRDRGFEPVGVIDVLWGRDQPLAVQADVLFRRSPRK